MKRKRKPNLEQGKERKIEIMLGLRPSFQAFEISHMMNI